MNTLLQIATDTPYWNYISTAVTIASIIAAITPTPKAGSKLAIAYKLLNAVALNVLKNSKK